jgi:Fur family transcriptional regulator, zinc uptake regulator
MKHCSDPNHHHDAATIVNEIAMQCEARGLRLTPIRTRVLELIADAKAPAKAYDLLKSLKSEHDSAAPPTIYRALDFLLENGFVHRVESINAYVVCPHPSGAHVAQFLVCDICGDAIELESHDLPTRLTQLAHAQNFSVNKLVVEVHGVCASCSTPKPLVLAPAKPERKSLTRKVQ